MIHQYTNISTNILITANKSISWNHERIHNFMDQGADPEFLKRRFQALFAYLSPDSAQNYQNFQQRGIPTPGPP